MSRERWPELWQLLATCFHEDWLFLQREREDEETWQAAMGRHVRDWPQEGVRTAIRQLRELLALDVDEERLSEIVWHELLVDYYPPGDGLTMRQWLVALRDLLVSLAR